MAGIIVEVGYITCFNSTRHIPKDAGIKLLVENSYRKHKKDCESKNEAEENLGRYCIR